MLRHCVLSGLCLLATLPVWPVSYYTRRFDDSRAVYLTPGSFSVHGDGVADDSDAIQQAIDKVQETTGQGVVFVPAGRYRISRTIYIWPGIRLIGVGATRPALVLGANTPGFQDENNGKQMIFFAGARPGSGRWAPPAGSPPPDANPGTFYSALSNIDIEIRDGNPGAVGVRAKYAQHCYLAHMDFHTGAGLAGVHEAGNAAEDVHFFGGKYGVWTGMPSPGWQFTMVDATFEGQREAAIREHEAGLTLVRPHFRNVPTAISIDPDFPDELWVKDGRMENITGPAVVISLEKNAQTEINMENVICSGVPVFASFRESGKKVAGPAAMYRVKTFSHGLHFADVGAVPEYKDIFAAAALSALPPAVASDLPDLPARDGWVNVRTLGAKGDGVTDDTAALRQAIAAHRALYFPMGKYLVSDTLTLRPETVLIGLHPAQTQIALADNTPAFKGPGGPKALLEAPQGGHNIVIGIGLYTNGINRRAVAAKWMAGADSLMNDVRFLGGHGTADPTAGKGDSNASWMRIYNNTHTADSDLNRRWDAQYPSLWVTNDGGGTFLNIWTPSTFAQAGMLVSDTTTAGRVYEMSSEHHVRHEIQLRNAANWSIYALQTEEERGEGGFALPLEIESSRNITVANFHIYRVISTYQPFPWAIKVSNSRDIHFRNVHCWSNSKVSFDSAVFDQTHNVEIRQREFAWLDLSGNVPPARVKPASTIVAPGAKVEKLAGGFFNVSGGAVSPDGDFYFVDAHWQRIYHWAAAARQLATVRDDAIDPVNLAFDRAGNLMVVSYAGNCTVYAFDPRKPDAGLTVLQPQAAASRPGLTAVLPAGDWRVVPNTLAQPYRQFVSPDGTTFLPVGRDFMEGATSWGVKSSAQIRGFSLSPAAPGKPFYIVDEAQLRTWTGTAGPDGSLTGLKVFAEQGGEGSAVDAAGNVYVAAGQIYVYSPAGKLIDTIEVPERPLQLAFGGRDGRTLFIPARTSLYAIRTVQRGR